jgi:hypothetical protein
LTAKFFRQPLLLLLLLLVLSLLVFLYGLQNHLGVLSNDLQHLLFQICRGSRRRW